MRLKIIKNSNYEIMINFREYDPHKIELIKKIDKNFRKYDPYEKIWYIKIEKWNEFCELFKNEIRKENFLENFTEKIKKKMNKTDINIPNISLKFHYNKFMIDFNGYNSDYIYSIKEIDRDSRIYDSESKIWIISLNKYEEFKDLFKNYENWDKLFQKWDNEYKKINEEEEKKKIEKEKKKIEKEKEIQEEYKKALKKQLSDEIKGIYFESKKKHLNELIYKFNKNGLSLDGSEMGTGKTDNAIALAKSLKMKICVITKKPIISFFIEKLNEYNQDYIFVINYEMIKTGKWKGKDSNDKKSTPNPYLDKNGKEFKWKLPENTLLVFDEVHLCKNYKTLNAKLLECASYQKVPLHLMSATFTSNPLKMSSLGRGLGLFFGKWGFWNWIDKNNLKIIKNKWGGYEWIKNEKDIAFMNKILYHKIDGKGHRLTQMDVSQMPENIVNKKYIKSNKIVNEEFKKLTIVLKKLEEKKDRTTNRLAEIQKTLQITEIYKIPYIFQEIKDLFDEEMSAVIFLNYNDSINELESLLSKENIKYSEIRGGQKQSVRDNEVKKFIDDDVRVCIANINAGGVGISLNDQHGKYPRKSLICPNYSEVDTKQALGRIVRANNKSKAIQDLIFFNNNTDKRLSDILIEKMDTLEKINKV